MTSILVRFPDESVKLDDVEQRRVLTRLEVIYDGGSLHGKTADFPTRDLERLVVGAHRRNWHSFETYERTICVDIRSRRTIFRYAGERAFAMPGLTSKPNNSSWWERLLGDLRIPKLTAIEI
jgi:transposase